MANTITLTTMMDGPRNVIRRIQISGDNSGDEAATQVLDASALATWRNQACNDVRIDRVVSNLAGFAAQLLFDATANVKAIDISDGDSDTDLSDSGGITNNAGVGKTGDILLTTTGLGTEEGTIIIYGRKGYAG